MSDTDTSADTGTDPNSTADELADFAADAPSWDEIREVYQTADGGGQGAGGIRKHARELALRRLLADHAWFSFAHDASKDTLYWYDPNEGAYRERGFGHLKRILRDPKRLGLAYTDREAAEIANQLAALTAKSERELRDARTPGLIPVANGVIDVRNGADAENRELLPHSPKYHFTSRCATPYHPGAEAPLFRTTLSETAHDGSTEKKVMEMAGYTLQRDELPYHKSLFVVGNQASGKSTVLGGIRGVLDGGDMLDSLAPTTSLTVQEMTGSRFKSHKLDGAWANFRSELPPTVVQGRDPFKEIVAGDAMTVEAKNVTSWKIIPTAKHLFAANELPEVEGADDAFFRRILLAPFPDTIPKEKRDPDLPEKLAQERSGILNEMLDGLARLHEQGGFTADLTPELTRETWDKWGNSVRRFYEEHMTKATTGKVAAQDAYDAYKAYCSAEGIPARSYSAMRGWLTNMGGQYDSSPDAMKTKAYFNDRGKQLTAFEGIELTESGTDLLLDERKDGDGDPESFW